METIKAKIKVEKRYKITINGVTHTDFKKISEWEGMAKFQNKKGVVIVDQGVPDLFATFDGVEGVEIDICKMSPTFWDDLIGRRSG